MSPNFSKPPSRTAVGLLLGVCIGAVGVLYFRKRRATTGSIQNASQSVSRTEESPSGYAPQPGDILLFHNARGLNRLITRFTGSPFYHAALYAGDGKTIEARTPGIQRGDLRGRERDFVVAPAPKEKGDAALAWAETQVGDAYDNLDIAVIILDRLCRSIHFNYTPKNKFSCGEFVAVAFDKAGAHLFPERDLGDVVPGDFAQFVPAAMRHPVR